MWTHFGHFVGLVFGVFFDSIGSTLLGRLVDTAFAMSIAVAVLYQKHLQGGWRMMFGHWKDEYKAGLRFAVWSAIVIYTPVIVWSVGKAVYDDHQGLMGAAGRIKVSLKSTRDTLGKQADDVRSQLASEQVQCAKKDGQNETLQKQNRDEQVLISGCQAEAIKRLIPEPFKETVTFLEDIPSNDKDSLYSRRWLVMTNKTITPMSMTVQCWQPTESLSANLAGISSAIQITRVGPQYYRLDISSAAWSPSSPLVATVKYKGGKPFDAMTCSFLANP